jgi:hypothetical protein
MYSFVLILARAFSAEDEQQHCIKIHVRKQIPITESNDNGRADVKHV